MAELAIQSSQAAAVRYAIRRVVKELEAEERGKPEAGPGSTVRSELAVETVGVDRGEAAPVVASAGEGRSEPAVRHIENERQVVSDPEFDQRIVRGGHR